MKISKIIFHHLTLLIILFCDLKFALAASAINSDYTAMFSARKETKSYEAETYVEYYKDHEISEKQARDSLRNMRESDFATPRHCKPCSREHNKYCHSEQMLKDHCCCNQSHNKEQLYFIPHTCYINEERCTPSFGSCLTVSDIRNCCCDTTLKTHWKSVLSDANTSGSSKYLSLMLALVVAVYNR